MLHVCPQKSTHRDFRGPGGAPLISANICLATPIRSISNQEVSAPQVEKLKQQLAAQKSANAELEAERDAARAEASIAASTAAGAAVLAATSVAAVGTAGKKSGSHCRGRALASSVVILVNESLRLFLNFLVQSKEIIEKP